LIIVTGGAGFIGSQIVRALNARGRRDVLVVDHLEDGRKVRNLASLDVWDVVDRDVFLAWITGGHAFGEAIDAVLHQGACSNTMEWDGRRMMRLNYDYSKALLEYCTARRIPLIYASSASVYGRGQTFVEERKYETPLNPYAYSKLLFDERVRRALPRGESQIAGLRYFNVYGPGEQHKGAMASIAFKLYRQLAAHGHLELFGASHGCGPGEHRRDFVWVEDCAAVALWLLDHSEVSGVFNVGTGRAQSFNEVARAVATYFGRGEVRYVPCPEALLSSYQAYTQADVSRLRGAGCDLPFLAVEDAVPRYMRWLEQADLFT
jgi:ADP-L-glycero-D-manno-heptose 6-epimerase